MPSVLAILADGFEEIETVAPIDLLRRAGVHVTTASRGTDLYVKGRSDMVLRAVCRLEALAAPCSFDCLFLPGGPGVKLLREDRRVQGLVKDYAHDKKWLAAICAAPVILADAGLLQRKRYTAHFSVANELPLILSGMRVVVDGKLITSRGAGTSIDFGLALVEHLVSPAKAREISAAICA